MGQISVIISRNPGSALSANQQSADRTVTLGTPSDITNSTTNSVTSTSHSHALGFVAAEVYTGSSASVTAYPLGHVSVCISASTTMNSTLAPKILTGDLVYSESGTGSALTGTWRSRGHTGANYYVMQRTA